MIRKSGRCIAISRFDFFSVGNENVDVAFRTEGMERYDTRVP